MPRSGDGVWTDIPNITAVPGQTIESADWNNYRADLRDNEFNAARPITAGGTGATNAEDALSNLGGVGVSNFLDAYPIGDFYGSVRTLDATWLRRDGELYDVDDYPDLAALLPELPDGVLWETYSSGTTAVLRGIIWDGDQYVAVGGSNGNPASVTTSPDGEEWTPQASIADAYFYDIAYGASIYVAAEVLEGRVYTSTNTQDWSPQTVINASGVRSVCWSQTLALFVAVGTGGYIGTSDDGATWTTRTSGVATELERVRDFNGTLVIVGSSGEILTSTNATSWTIRTSGTSSRLYNVSEHAGVYLVTGISGVILSSTNLSAWTARTSGTSSALFASVSAASGYVAAGASGVARISDNLSSWAAAPTGLGGDLREGIVDPNNDSRYILVGPASTVLVGLRTGPTQFRVPSDDPTYGWIKALEELP